MPASVVSEDLADEVRRADTSTVRNLIKNRRTTSSSISTAYRLMVSLLSLTRYSELTAFRRWCRRHYKIEGEWISHDRGQSHDSIGSTHSHFHSRCTESLEEL